jgi:hypothetical protein
VSVDGPGTIIDSGGEFIAGPGGSRDGIGDVVLAGTLYDLVRNDDARFYLDLVGRVKFGTASRSEGLGTGENDYSLQADLLKDFDRLALFATAGYKLRGDPQGIDLRNIGFGTLGGDYRIAQGMRAGLMFDYRPSAVQGAEALKEATAYVALSRKGGMTFQPYVVAGFSDSSPDWGAGLSLGWRWRAD